MWKRLISTAVGLSFLVAPLHAFAHGGGLDRHGCHNERATGGYHCHRNGEDDDDDVDWETIGYVVGGLVLLAILARAVTGQKSLSLTDTDAPDPRMGVIPYLAGNDTLGLKAYYDASPSSRLGVHMEHEADREESRIGASWGTKF